MNVDFQFQGLFRPQSSYFLKKSRKIAQVDFYQNFGQNQGFKNFGANLKKILSSFFNSTHLTHSFFSKTISDIHSSVSFNQLAGNQPLKSPVFLRQIRRIFETYFFFINKLISNVVLFTFM